MKKLLLFILLGIFTLAFTGCGSMGTFRANNVTSVELSKANFNIVARDLEGSAMQGYLFGISAPAAQGSDVATVGLIKVSGDDKPYATAVKRLWDSYKEKYGDTEGKKLALINIHQDSEVLNTLVYTEATIYITADVIEFVD